jgi:hypothetical protein
MRYVYGNRPIHYVIPFEFNTACGIKTYYISKVECSDEINIVECKQCLYAIKIMRMQFNKDLARIKKRCSR